MAGLWLVEVEVFSPAEGLAETWLPTDRPVPDEWVGGGYQDEDDGDYTHAQFVISAVSEEAALARANGLVDEMLTDVPTSVLAHPGFARTLTARPTTWAALDSPAEPRGPEDFQSKLVAAPWHRCDVASDDRTLRIVWVTGPDPLERVEQVDTEDALTITLLERHPPAFAPDGTPNATAAVAVIRCVTVFANKAVAGRLVIDGATGTPPEEIKPGHYGQRLDRREALAIDLDHIECPAVSNAVPSR